MHVRFAVAVLSSALLVTAAPAAARVCGRWIATMQSASGSATTIRMLVRRCGLTEAPSHLPPACTGVYRCHGPACPSKRGRFSEFGRAMSDETWTFGTGEFRPRHRRAAHGVCFTISGVLPGEPSRYTCYGSDGTVVDQGTLTCVTSRACGAFSC